MPFPLLLLKVNILRLSWPSNVMYNDTICVEICRLCCLFVKFPLISWNTVKQVGFIYCTSAVTVLRQMYCTLLGFGVVEEYIMI